MTADTTAFHPVIAQDRGRRLRGVCALTSTADGYLTARGVRPVARAEAPTDLEVSAELAGACPVDARLLVLELET